MKVFVALLPFLAAAAAVGTGMGNDFGMGNAGNGMTDGTNFNAFEIGGAAADIGTGTSAMDVGGSVGGSIGGSSDSLGVAQSETSDDTSGNDGSDDDGSDNGSDDDSSGENSNGGSNGQMNANLGSMNLRQKGGVAAGTIIAIVAVVAVAGVGFYLYKRRQNGAQMLSNA